MSDYNSALYFAREAAIKYQKSGKCWDAEDAAQRLVGLLAALDAARGEAVWQVSLSKSPECWSDYDSETTANAVAKASGNKCREVRAVYLAPPAALAVPVCDGCNGRGEIGGPLGDGTYQTDPCPWCAAAQQPAAEAPGDVQRDAARYRYLRREGAWEQHDLCVTGSVSAIFVSDGRVGHATEGAQLDAAIDRAMLAAAKKD